MIFEIYFNHEHDDKVLVEIGAKIEELPNRKYPPYELVKIELNTFEELEQLLNKINSIKGKLYSAVINFDPPAIFLDDKV
jgi:hypothetical protein